MTIQRRIDWELGGLDASPSIATTGWRRPRSVELDAEELVFEWWGDTEAYARTGALSREVSVGWLRWRDRRRFLMTFGVADAFPSRGMLLRFAQLADAPAEKIRQFAERFGALQEQMSDDGDEPVPPLLPERQALGYWRGISRSFARALDLAGQPERRIDQEANLLYLVNGHLLQSAATDFLTFEGGRPRVLRASGGLYGGLAAELLSVAAKVGLRRCQGCGGEVEPGGRQYCGPCRDAAVPAKIRQQRHRTRRKAEPG